MAEIIDYGQDITIDFVLKKLKIETALAYVI
jgi:hypothetical protein